MTGTTKCPLPEECPTPERPFESENGIRMHLVNSNAHEQIGTWEAATRAVEGDLEADADQEPELEEQPPPAQATASGGDNPAFGGPKGAPVSDGGSNGDLVELSCGHEEIDISSGEAAEQIDEHGFTIQECEECGQRDRVFP